MACIGPYQRNVVTFDQTFVWLLCKASSTMIMAISSAISVNFGGKAQFWIWNITAFFVYEGFYLVLPLVLGLSMPQTARDQFSNMAKVFYVRKPVVLEPRRSYSQYTEKERIHPARVIYVTQYRPPVESYGEASNVQSALTSVETI